MSGDLSAVLWLLKLGAVLNLYLLVRASTLPTPDPHVVIPAQILLAVSAFRCLFPNRYVDNVVFHDTALSSIFLTRLLATFSEVAYVYQFSHVIRVLNVNAIGWVDGLSWWMLAQVVASQGFVWSAIVTRRGRLYFWEELGWLVIFGANTLASACLHATAEGLGEGKLLLRLSLAFGVIYLPWQVLHLRSLAREARQGRSGEPIQVIPASQGLYDALHRRNRRRDARAWGGAIGATWMLAYFATLVPVWVCTVAVVASSR